MTVTRQPSWSGRHADAADLLVSAAFGLVVGVGTIAQRGTDPDAVLAAISLGAAVGLAVLWSLRRRRGRAEQEARTRLEQRLEIARELHDVVAHHVSVIGIQAAAARRTLGGPPDATTTALAAIEASSRAAVQEMQHLVIQRLRRDDDPVHSGGNGRRDRTGPGPARPARPVPEHDLGRSAGGGDRLRRCTPRGSPGVDPGRPLPGDPGSADQRPPSRRGPPSSRSRSGSSRGG